jgi:hypothetical protein
MSNTVTKITAQHIYADNTPPLVTIRNETISKRKYLVKSVYIGTRDIQDVILSLAEEKAFREMGL